MRCTSDNAASQAYPCMYVCACAFRLAQGLVCGKGIREPSNLLTFRAINNKIFAIGNINWIHKCTQLTNNRSPQTSLNLAQLRHLHPYIACWKRTGLLTNMLYLISLEEGQSPALTVHHEEANARAVLQCLTLYLHTDFHPRLCGSSTLTLKVQLKTTSV